MRRFEYYKNRLGPRALNYCSDLKFIVKHGLTDFGHEALLAVVQPLVDLDSTNANALSDLRLFLSAPVAVLSELRLQLGPLLLSQSPAIVACERRFIWHDLHICLCYRDGLSSKSVQFPKVLKGRQPATIS